MTHPITPPPELVYDWAKDRVRLNDPTPLPEYIAARAAQWGADQELQACGEWLMLNGYGAVISRLRAARRPKPPSLKEQALDELHISFDRGYLKEGAADTIRRALEALPE